MMQDIFTNVTNGRIIDSCSVPKIPEKMITLVKNNYLGEFKTKLERAKVKRNLGIVDHENIVWSDISGAIEDNPILVAFMENVTFDVTKLQTTIDASQIKTLQDAIVYVYGQNQQVQQYNAIVSAANINAAEAKQQATNLTTALFNGGIPNEVDIIGTIRSAITGIQNQIGNTESEDSLITRISSLESTSTAHTSSISDLTALIGTTTDGVGEDTNTSTIYGIVNTVTALANTIDSETSAIRNNANTILALATQVTQNKNDITSIKTDYYKVSDADDTFATKTSLDDYYKKTESDDKYALKTSLTSYLLSSDAASTYVKKSDLGGSDYNFITASSLASTLEDYLEKDSEISITGLTSKEDSITLKKPFSIDESIGALDPDLVRESKADLLTLPRYWKGMTVVIVETIEGTSIATQYILQDVSKATNPDFSGWRPESSMRFQTLTQTAYDAKVTDGTLDANIYYFIEEPEELAADSAVTYPEQNEGESDEEFAIRVTAWQNNIRILHHQYMSAAWGNELSATLASKASSSQMSALLRSTTELIAAQTTKIAELEETITLLTNRIVLLETLSASEEPETTE